jgi:hypothetical protein
MIGEFVVGLSGIGWFLDRRRSNSCCRRCRDRGQVPCTPGARFGPPRFPQPFAVDYVPVSLFVGARLMTNAVKGGGGGSPPKISDNVDNSRSICASVPTVIRR